MEERAVAVALEVGELRGVENARRSVLKSSFDVWNFRRVRMSAAVMRRSACRRAFTSVLVLARDRLWRRTGFGA